MTAREVHDHSAAAVQVIRSDEEQIGADWLTYAIDVSAFKYVDNPRALGDIARLDTHAYVCGYVQCFKAIRAVLEQGQVKFRKHSGRIRGTFGEHLSNLQGTFGEHLGSIR
jgi:hypothetical protein